MIDNGIDVGVCVNTVDFGKDMAKMLRDFGVGMFGVREAEGQDM